MAIILPEDLIFFEILTRLPLRFLLRLTLICKRWHFLITNPGSIDFHIAHASHHLYNSPSFLVKWYFMVYVSGFNIVSKDQNNVSINRINDSIRSSCKKIFSFYDSVMEVSNSVKVYPENAVSVIGSAHGLVCFCQNFTCNMYFILNPATKMFKTVTELSNDLFEIEKIHNSRSAFCYDPIDRDFKIVKIERDELLAELGKVLVRVHVYSCNNDTWTAISIRDDFIPSSEFYIAGNLKGRLYVKFLSKPEVLVAFNVHDVVFKQLPCAENSIEGAEFFRYVNWKDSFGATLYKKPDDQEALEQVVYTLDETTSAWIEQYILPKVPDLPQLYVLRLGLEYGHVVADEFMGEVVLFEAQSSQFNNLTYLGAPANDVMPYRESLVCINGMQQL